jgi:hypothetical protein
MQTTTIDATSSTKPQVHREADVRRGPILGKTIFRELRSNGMSNADVVAVATELLALVTSEMREQ